jgi:sugar O-acyltransferase (sialic acid O-acetyltransferase NeuD family)
MKDMIIIVGGGGHARAIMDAIRSTACFGIKGIVDPSLNINDKIEGVDVLGDDTYFDSLAGRSIKYFITIGVGLTMASDKRKRLYDKLSDSFQFPVIIHSSAYVSGTASLRSGTQVMAGAIIQSNAVVEDNVIVNTGAIVEHDCIIGAHSHIASGAILGGGVRVGSCSHIGMGARIIQGVQIGGNVTVGAGAVVVADVLCGKTVAGVPAKDLHA